jgi:FAD/FMN-containing dehydrogenase
MARIPNQAITTLKSQLKGELLLPHDGGFDAARVVWNAMIDRKPAMIVRCAGVSDVMRSVTFARDHALPVSVKGGGHNIAGSAVCDDGLTIDFSAMKAVRVDAEKRLARVEPGALLSDFDAEAQKYGLATPLGINSTTGVAGLTLGGGFGWLTRKFGMSIDNLLSADVMTAQGEQVRANARENPDLFWALRGGGGNFGVVTQFEFQLHPVGPELLSGLVVFPFENARELLQKYRTLAAQIPEDLNVWTVLRDAPPLPFLPAEVHGKKVVIFPFIYTGDVQAGLRAIEPLRKLGRAHGEHFGAQPYTAWQQAFDPLLTPGARNYWKSHNFTDLSDGAIDSVIDAVAKLPSPQCEIFIGLVSGCANRVAKDATAYAHRDAKFVMNVHSRWDKAEDDNRCITWAREFFNASARYATGGVYVNFLTQDEAERIPAAYGSNYERLAQIKRKYDPTNLFRVNQNIKPA